MNFPDPLIPGRLVKRYKRFLADVELPGGEVVTAHCANSGSMMGLKDPGMDVWLSPSRNPARKLKYTLELVAADGALVGVNTALPNGLAEDAILAGKIPELVGYGRLRREVKYGKNSRIDILLEDDAQASPGLPPCYVEVKSVTLSRERGLAEFPDAVTARGAKHLVELGDMVEDGNRAVMLYLAQRADCDRFAIAADIDPGYQKALDAALERGVELLCYTCVLTTESISVDAPLPFAPR